MNVKCDVDGRVVVFLNVATDERVALGEPDRIESAGEFGISTDLGCKDIDRFVHVHQKPVDRVRDQVVACRNAHAIRASMRGRPLRDLLHPAPKARVAHAVSKNKRQRRVGRDGLRCRARGDVDDRGQRALRDHFREFGRIRHRQLHDLHQILREALFHTCSAGRTEKRGDQQRGKTHGSPQSATFGRPAMSSCVLSPLPEPRLDRFFIFYF